MTIRGIPIGGLYFVEKQILNILRKDIPDPGFDDPNAVNGSGHSLTRDAMSTFSSTGDGATQYYTLTPPVSKSSVVCILDVVVDGRNLNMGYDYIIDWGDKFGDPDQRSTRIYFITPPANGAVITIPYKYDFEVMAPGNKAKARGSFIAAGWSRGNMPLPKIQANIQSSDMESVGVGDNYDYTLMLGQMYHNMEIKIVVMSMYPEECKTLADQVIRTLFQGGHKDYYQMTELKPKHAESISYNMEQKAYTIEITGSLIHREIL